MNKKRKTSNEIRIKWLVAKLNKKQFFWIYGVMLLLLVVVYLWFYFFPLDVSESESDLWKTIVRHSSSLWLFWMVGVIWEAQFYWHRFTKEQLKVIENQKERLATQNIELEEKNHEILLQKQNIEASISYAQRIQNALLPSQKLLQHHFPNHFIFYRPKDIVSGDFYWLSHVSDNKLMVVVADCTGHGVPGAFMSMLSIAFLNDIAKTDNITPAKLLNELRTKIINALETNTDTGNKMQDGLDAAVVMLESEQNTLRFSGANNSLYVSEKDKLTKYKAQKMPIGSYRRDNVEFVDQIVAVNSGDQIYLFSDGFMDQIGSATGKRYMSKRFQEFLHRQYPFEMHQQRQNLEQEFKKWCGSFPQLDDILVAGIQV